jgi:hypothetical protein
VAHQNLGGQRPWPVNEKSQADFTLNMVLTLIIWLIVGCAAWGYSRIFFTAHKCEKTENYTLAPESLAARLYVGMLCLVCLLAAAAIFVPVRWWIGLIAVGLGVSLSVSGYTRLAAHIDNSVRSGTLLLALLGCMALFVSTREVNFFDTGLYHHQAVKWLSDYGLVTGLAMIHVRYGSPSSWFAGAAALNHGFLSAREVPIVGGICFALLGVTSLISLCQIAQGRLSVNLRTVTWVVFSAMLMTVCLLWNVEASLSPDLVVWIASPVIVLLATDTFSDPSERAGRGLLVSVLACAVKVTALPLVAYSFVFCAWCFIRNPGHRGKLLKYAVGAAFVVALLVASNFKASGCPLFPSSVGCSSASFSVGAEVAVQTAAGIRQFAHAGSRQTLPLLLAAIFASLLVLRLSPSDKFVYQGLGTSFCGLLFVVATAPNPRFGMGYFLFPLALAVAALLCRAQSFWANFLGGKRYFVQVVIALCPLALCAAAVFQMTSVSELLVPPKLASTNGDAIHVLNRRQNVHTTLSVSPGRVRGLVIWRPGPESSDQCWDAPLPCTPKLSLSGVELRDPRRGFGAGFEARPDSTASNEADNQSPR